MLVARLLSDIVWSSWSKLAYCPSFFRFHFSVILCVFADMLCGLGHVLSIRWVLEGEVTSGPYCTGQSVLMQIGNNGVAWFTTAIAVLTYLQVVHRDFLGKNGARVFVVGCICFTIVFATLVVAIPASINHPYYGNAGLWCWISGTNASRQRLRFASQFVWIWVAITVSIAAYGWVAYKWLRQAPFRAYYDLRRAAIAMGWYPITYLIVATPTSVARFRQFHGYKPTLACGSSPMPLLPHMGPST
ncbi:uncharacterized protein EI90DRAFT_3024458, partial [Cantharellus anzutake]|uniref:uncharacterized protein n=1 Tax=Cantharellus anzutake TaxID=1750568 RepID=UPI001906D0B1